MLKRSWQRLYTDIKSSSRWQHTIHLPFPDLAELLYSIDIMSLIWPGLALRGLSSVFDQVKTTVLFQSDSGAAVLPVAIQFLKRKQRTVTASLMRYQFKSKVILTGLCSGDTSALRLQCKAIEGSYSRDPVSRFDNRAECRLWHRPSCSGCCWHSSGTA